MALELLVALEGFSTNMLVVCKVAKVTLCITYCRLDSCICLSFSRVQLTPYFWVDLCTFYIATIFRPFVLIDQLIILSKDSFLSHRLTATLARSCLIFSLVASSSSKLLAISWRKVEFSRSFWPLD